MNDLSSRRPLSVRSTGWARSLAGVLAKSGISPNAISAASIGAALFGSGSIIAAGNCVHPWPAAWIVGAVFIQLRLICNLMDGMVAIEGGKKSPTGELWNEIPDRIADPILLVSAGWAAGLPWVGALAGWAAIMTAYVRSIGATLTGEQDFCGPFAKQQRMACLTIAVLLTAAESLWQGDKQILQLAVILIAVGTCITLVRRILRLAKKLRKTGP
ncbi:MAG: CDP-alcohol phosphatidyltransferase family protein [Verrucomicrobia bacterium]|nr:MAG: CDP-alcohol phosphatidyltransferase family protein [Verrucomicrobiota bacterium]TAE87285.1 MAG: CDP-alcohol phosphatidyltransferase family protein [Verrucomicrobiota bacterium]TAF25121.1 MAG: CDP-alcohol phosphatidyltransferase family protein [Verrucomicrobiota bacterium]